MKSNSTSANRDLILVLVFNALVISSSIFLALVKGVKIGWYFAEGNTPITLLSTIQLLVLSIIAWDIFRKRRASNAELDNGSSYMVWILIALGFLFLSLDERLLIHENMDSLIHNIFNIKESNITDRIDDLIIGAYGLTGIASVYYFRSEFTRYRTFFPLVASGFVLLFLMVVTDILTNSDDILSAIVASPAMVNSLMSAFGIIEESLKLFAEAFFIAAFYGYLKAEKPGV